MRAVLKTPTLDIFREIVRNHGPHRIDRIEITESECLMLRIEASLKPELFAGRTVGDEFMYDGVRVRVVEESK